MDDRRTLDDVVRAVWVRTPQEVRQLRTPDGPEWVAGDRRIAFSEDQPDDEGTMLYLWAEYEAETTPGGWETYWYCVGDGGGPEAALLATLEAWVAGLVAQHELHQGGTWIIAEAPIGAPSFHWDDPVEGTAEDAWFHVGETIAAIACVPPDDATVPHGEYAAAWPGGTFELVDDTMANVTYWRMASDGPEHVESTIMIARADA